MDEEAIIEAVYQAAIDHIYSVVPAKRVEDLDVSVCIEGQEITIEVVLLTDRGEGIDQRTADEAIRIASEKADELMKRLD
ncbi:MAG TPA: DUF3194 domain-containing protein [Methanocella sp.]|nr:DUF3194 domain-containing protein [Methanocella sp.]